MCRNVSLVSGKKECCQLVSARRSVINSEEEDSRYIKVDQLEIVDVRETHYCGGNVVLHDGKSRRRAQLD